MTWAGVPYLSLTISKTVWPFLVVDPAVNCLNIDLAVLKHLLFFFLFLFSKTKKGITYGTLTLAWMASTVIKAICIETPAAYQNGAAIP